MAEAGLSAVEAIDAADASDIPERTAYGEVQGQMLAAGRYRNHEAIQIRTELYDFVWCVLPPDLATQFGVEQKLLDVWQGRTVGVFGKLSYLSGGRLNRIDAEEIREIEAPIVDLSEILDPDFTSGLDPLDYLERLHEGTLTEVAE